MEQILAGRIAIVTGGGAGLGKAACEIMAREGATVVVSDINLGTAEEVAHLIESTGGRAIAVKTDVAKLADIDALMGLTVKTYGRVDCAFNNAGIHGEGVALADYSEAGFDSMIAINLKAVWYGMKLQIRQMLSQGGGAIVNNSSVGGLGAKPGLSVYCASKHAVLGLTKAAALEYGSLGVRVNAVCPGVVRTPMLESLMKALGGTPEIEAAWRNFQPIGRFGTPDEIGEVVTWLLSDRASLIHGHALAADGGMQAEA
ncbi:MAG: glucose 1-dehydrogenase [Proteobacteria bacterium]|nr:glucose 1-dehydrogenase [Pseudomonadota bacterium]